MTEKKANPESLLKDIFMLILEGIKKDLANDERRTPALINASIKMMESNGINLDGLKALRDELVGEGNPAGARINDILSSMPAFDDENPVTH